MTTIYISSTYEDLKDHRRAVYEALRKAGFQVVAMEDYVATDNRPVSACLASVDRADVYIGLVAYRYGYVPPEEHHNPEGLSITELEFRHAVRAAKPTLMFLLDENTPWANSYNDAWTGEGDSGARVKRLREYITREQFASFFSSPHQLASLVLSAVSRHLGDRQNQESQHELHRAITWDLEMQGSPYPGLMHFTRNDAPVYFGREVEVREVLDRMTSPNCRFMLVSGSSGNGKSSFVDAGILPRLEEEGFEDLYVRGFRMVPTGGHDPFDALLRSLAPIAEEGGFDPLRISRDLIEGTVNLRQAIDLFVPPVQSKYALVLVLDQMEELFTNKIQRGLVASFLSNLFAATQEGTLLVIATIRSDFLHHCYEHPDMLAVLRGSAHYVLGSVTPYSMRDLIVRPAQCAGLRVSEKLVRRLIQDAGDEPGSLPLLAFVLRELFDRREGDTLSENVYEELGGLEGSVSTFVELLERQLRDTIGLANLEQRLPELFHALVSVDSEGVPKRRRAPLQELPVALMPIVERLTQARVLAVESYDGGSVVYVAHEIFFYTWSTFAHWIADTKDDLHMLSMAEIDAKEWQKHEYEAAYLWHKDRLQRLQGVINRLNLRNVPRIVKLFAFWTGEAPHDAKVIEPSADIFISYEYTDIKQIRKLANVLESYGWSVYLPSVTSSMRTWNDANARVLDQSRCIVVAWSFSSIQSELVSDEAREAQERGILVPVLIEDVSVPTEFRRFQPANVSDWDGTDKHPAFQSLFDSISRLIGDPPQIVVGKRIKEIENLVTPYLDLANLGIKSLPDALFELDPIQELDLSGNKLTALPQSIGRLKQLKRLDLSNNELTWLPDSLAHLMNLEKLDLHGNQLTWLPESISQLMVLNALDLSGNCLKSLPTSLSKLESLSELDLRGNDALGIPPDILNPSSRELLDDTNSEQAQEILKYYFKTRSGPRPLNEAKLILVGDGRVGKTSLVNRLVRNTFDENENKTEGIQITEWVIRSHDGEQVHLNIWDFGGQEIMHSTHQFFLTEPSLYLLVLNGRQGHEELDAEYWLSLIGTFGGDSPVILVLNKIKEHTCNLNRRGLMRKFPAIRDFVESDCADSTGIDELRESIQREIDHLDHLHDSFPVSWFAIKDRLRELPENYVTFDKYREICVEYNEDNPRSQDLLATYLHRLGIALNYKDDPRLRDTYVLNPRWVTFGIYKILNAEQVAKRQGDISLTDLTDILDPIDYPPERHSFLFELMRKFELCFSFPEEEDRYLIPELLVNEQPADVDEFRPKSCLNFEYQYPAFPEGVLPRFIVRTNVLSTGRPRWRSGVILEFEGNRALIQAGVQEKRISIAVSGPVSGRRRLLAIIRSDLEHIHRSLKVTPQELIPVPDHPEALLYYRELLVMEQNEIKEIPKVVGNEVLELGVKELLNGVDLKRATQVGGRDSEEYVHGFRLFYSYAHKDETLRSELETQLKLLERNGLIKSWHDRRISAGNEWNGQIDENLNRADIILLLISADFISSDYCYDIEMKRALERHEHREARVIPIIVRDVIWYSAPFGKLQALPENAKPVTTWSNRDTAWRNVAEGIEKALKYVPGHKAVSGL